MRALTIRQPWAGAFFAEQCPKDIENRAQAFTYRGPVLIHAGQQLAGEPVAMQTVTRLTSVTPVFGGPRASAQWALGAVVGVADLVSIHAVDDCRGSCSPWALPARAHLRFENARLLARPVPAFGRLGLWSPSDDLLADVTRVGWAA